MEYMARMRLQWLRHASVVTAHFARQRSVPMAASSLVRALGLAVLGCLLFSAQVSGQSDPSGVSTADSSTADMTTTQSGAAELGAVLVDLLSPFPCRFTGRFAGTLSLSIC